MNTVEFPDSLSPAELNRNLVYAGLFLVAFELVRELVINRVKGFYANTTFGPGMLFRTYEQDVLARHKHAFEASLLFLRDHFEAISPDDVMAIQALREHRNVIAHELPRILPIMDPSENERLLLRAREALFRLSNFWVFIDIGADPEFKSKALDWKQIAGEDLMLLDHIIHETHSQRMAQ